MMSADFRRTHEALFDELERQGILSARRAVVGHRSAIDVVKLTQAVMTAQALIGQPPLNAPPPPACSIGQYQRCENCE